MVQLILSGPNPEDWNCLEFDSDATLHNLHEQIEQIFSLSSEHYVLQKENNEKLPSQDNYENELISSHLSYDGCMVSIQLLVEGGIDFQHREASKTGGGGQMSESQAALERKERLRKLALETIDITKDPYFLRNHLGTFECKLCLTLHPNEGNYLAHTQGKRHQYNLGRRAAMEAKNAAPRTMVTKEAIVKRTIKIGRPGYKVSLFFSFCCFCGAPNTYLLVGHKIT